MKHSITDKIRMLFVIRDETFYYHKEKGQVGTMLPDGGLLFEVGEEQVECRFVYKRKVSPEKQEEVLAYLDYKNIPEWEGKFEVDKEGTVSYLLCTEVSDTKAVAFNRLAAMKIMATKMGKETAENMYRIADGTATADELCREDRKEIM